ncbi:hypothetical protein [Phytohabitans rumicis]|uniref:EF-hand domain-containing protein n=1 Tax=Phytohabitans rumicis TaxID=1076125 RepID=A0A6V8LD95_9ACTN|nr:hypothetical protein [Phytohabitans rumicis]GFJ92559.1 hypothetical protein Prum_062010 [Phytohabitans rumicis]
MKRRTGPLRLILAAVLGVAVVLPATARPASADQDYGRVTIDLLRSLLDKGGDGRLSPDEVASLVLEAIGAITDVKVDLLARLDAQAVADLRAKTATATTSVNYLRYPHTAATYLGIVNPAAHQAKEYLALVESDAAKDAVGRAMITLYSALLVAEAKTGVLNPNTRYADYRAALEELRRQLEPHCEESLPGEHPNFYAYSCTFNGRTVAGYQRLRADGQWEYTHVGDGSPANVWLPGEYDREIIAGQTMDGTADELAEKALLELAARGY